MLGQSFVLSILYLTLKGEKIEELKASVVEDKPFIHTVEGDNNGPHYHNVSVEKLF